MDRYETVCPGLFRKQRSRALDPALAPELLLFSVPGAALDTWCYRTHLLAKPDRAPALVLKPSRPLQGSTWDWPATPGPPQTPEGGLSMSQDEAREAARVRAQKTERRLCGLCQRVWEVPVRVVKHERSSGNLPALPEPENNHGM